MKKEKLDILYEDKNIIIVNKKSGLLTISTEKEKEKTLYHEVSDYLWHKNKNNKVFIVHRLDKDTSGIVLFAKNIQTKKYFQDNWQNVKREYFAVVHGKLKNKKGTIINYLKESSTYMVYETDSQHGKKSITNYELINENNDNSVVKINIETGRKNQIRIAFSSIGNPIVGDKKYGQKDGYKNMQLHAYKIIFIHQITKKVITIESKLPKYFNYKL